MAETSPPRLYSELVVFVLVYLAVVLNKPCNLELTMSAIEWIAGLGGVFVLQRGGVKMRSRLR